MSTPRSVGHSRPSDTAPSLLTRAQDIFVDYFRCPPTYACFETADNLSSAEGYFTFGGAIAYGRVRGVTVPASLATDPMAAVHAGLDHKGRLELPFDLAAAVTNLREERYRQSASRLERLTKARAIQDTYYFLRPLLPVAVRRHLQRIRLGKWRSISFPRWPVDFSVDELMRHTIGALLKASGERQLPFVWFWPDGASSCAVMTHDVEGPAGQAFCDELIDLDESFGIRAAFQVVPEERGTTSVELVNHFRARGCEVNLHDLNHDGYLVHNKPQFLERAALINRYAREFGCRGFRAGAMYREQQWFDAFEFSYDMSVPNAAHLEPQRGGCCTVMPYFIGKILELPLTTTQDYSLFHFLGEYSIRRWTAQIDLIRSMNGLITFIAHPDYPIDRRTRDVYAALLAHLARLRDEEGVWMALPGEVDQWWRDRSRMTVVPYGNSWKIQGPGSDRARLAYATLDGDRVLYQLVPQS